MADILNVERRRELRTLAASVTSVEDAHRLIQAQALRANPQENASIFYYGDGVEGAKALATREGFVRVEQTERGYFLDQVTRNLAEDGLIARGSEQNKALFGHPDEKKLGEWGEASKEFAAMSNGAPVVFPDMNRGPEQFQRTVFFNAELPALSGNHQIHGLSAFSYTASQAGGDQEFAMAQAFAPVTPAFANDAAYGLNETQLFMVRVGGDSAADMIHAMGGDFGAANLAAPTAGVLPDQRQATVCRQSAATQVKTRIPTPEPDLKRGPIKR